MNRLIIFLLLIFYFARTIHSQPGEALHFDGVNDHVQVSSFTFGNNWTAEVWVNPSNVGGGWYSVLGQSHWNNMNGFVIAIVGGTVFAEGPQGMHIETTITQGVWTHLALTYNNGIFAFYKNGLIAGVQSAAFTNASTSFYMGLRTNNNGVGLIDPYNGAMDEVRLWNVTRSQCEIQSFMNCEIPSSASGLMANYHFNQGTAFGVNTLIFNLNDATGNGNSGSLNNFGLLLLSTTSNFIAPGGVVTGYTTTSVPSAEINLTGNLAGITDGDMSPTATDHTDFNSAISRTFVIQSTGSGTLNTGIPVITGPNSSDFSITTAPNSALAATTGTTSFVVTFIPATTGVKNATVNIYNSDCSEPIYDFAITATASAAACLHFDGTDDFIETGANIVELGLNDFTIETWIKTSSNDFGIATMQDNDGVWETGEKNFLLENDGHLSFVGYSCDYIQASTVMPVNDNSWHHVAVVWDRQTGLNGVGKIYIDGIDRTASSTYTANTTNIGTFRIGTPNYNESLNFFSGSFDEYRVWNVARTQCEIQAYMNCELAATSGLVANYHFNQGVAAGSNLTVTALADASGNSITGTLSNFSLSGASSNWQAPGGVTTGASCAAVLVAEINLQGNGISILNNDLVPAAADHTDFGNVQSSLARVFTIQNTGTGTLGISLPVTINGINASDFTITSQPASVIAPSGSSTFAVLFSPGATGVRSATLIISNTDCDESTYSFGIRGTQLGNSFSFDGTDDKMWTPVFNNASNNITLQAKVRWDGNTSATSKVIAYNGNTSTSGYGLFLASSSGSVCVLYGGIISPFAGVTLVPNQWTDLSLVIETNKFRLYADGILVSETFNTGNPSTPSGQFVIGANDTGAEHFGGWIDEVRLWNIALTQCDIQTYLNCEIPGSIGGLEANYHFNQGAASGNNVSVTVLTDASGNNNHLTLSNAALTGTVSNWVYPGAVPGGYTTISSPLAEVNVRGNGISISAGDLTPGLADHTDFGTVPTRTFVVQNTGSGTLNIGMPSLSGANPTHFSITTLPAAFIGPGSTASFVVSFAPSSAGVKTAVITLLTSDCDEPVYYFAITATATAASALKFDGINDFVETNANITDFSQADFTIETWLRTSGVSEGIFTLENNNGVWNAGEKSFYIDAGGIPGFVGFGNNSIHGNLAVNDNNWHHVAVVWDHIAGNSGVGKMYIDGADHTGAVNYAANNANGGTIKIGSKNYSTEAPNYFSGTLDELRFWNKVLCISEIVNNMNCEIPTSSAGLQANYHFNQGIAFGSNAAANVLSDASGSSYSGTLTGMALSGNNSNWVGPGAVTSGSSCTVFSAPEIAVYGNSVSITNNATVTSLADHSSFGVICVNSATVRTYSIQNSGTANLSITGFTVNGPDAALFIVGPLSPSSPISNGSPALFSVTFAPISAGVKTATLMIGNDDCDESGFRFAITGTAAALPAVTAAASAVSVCAGNPVVLTGGGATTYTWSNGVVNNVSYTPVVSNNYTVTGTNGSGCTNTAAVTVTVNPLPVITIGNFNICSGNTLTLNPTGAATYTYSGGGVVTPTVTTSYSITGTSASGCVSSNTAVTSITVNTTPTVNVNSGSICSGNTFTIVPSGAVSYTFINGGPVVSPVATTAYSVSGTSPQGCISVSPGISNVVVNPLPALSAVASNPAVCNGSTVTLTASGAHTYTWTGGVSNGLAFIPGASGSYSVTGSNTLTGCTSTVPAVVSITVNALPVISTTTPGLALCAGKSATLVAAGALTYTWNPGNVVGNNPVFSPAVSTQYSVSGTDVSGCVSSNTAVLNLTVNPLPFVMTTPLDTAICAGSPVTLNGAGADTYTWSPIITNGIAFVPAATTVYSVAGTSTLTGCTSTNLAVSSITVNPRPVITASVTSPSVCMGTTLALTGGGAHTYTWNPSAANGIPFIPLISQSYSVTGTNTLTGCTGTNVASVAFTVNALPVVSANASSPAVCAGSPVILTGGGASTYTWSPLVTNGVAFIPSTTGAYTVSGTNTLTGCSSTNLAITTVSVLALPVVSAAVSAPAVCAGSTLMLTGNGADTYTWSPAALNGVPFIPAASGSYSVSGSSTLTGCTSTNLTSVAFTVHNLPVITASTSQPSVCAGGSITLSGSGASTYTWNPGAINGVPFAPAATAIYSLSGTNSNGCTSASAATILVTVNTLPVISGTANNPALCIGSAVVLNGSGAHTYTWSPAVTNNVPFIPSASGSYTVTGTNTLTGCTSTNNAVVSLTVNSLPVVSASVTSNAICMGNTVVLTGSGADSYTWTPSLVNNTAFVPNATATYSVSGSNTLTGCTSTNNISITITVNPLPVISASSSSSAICMNNQVTLTGAGADTYTWLPAGVNGVPFVPTVTTIYSVTGTSTLTGCTGTNLATTAVTVHPLPVVTAAVSTPSACSGGSITLSGGGADTYTWNPPAPNGQPFSPLTSSTYTVSGTYTLTGCTSSNTATVSVTVEPVPVITGTVNKSVVCDGEQVIFSANGAFTYTWTGGVTNLNPFTPATSGSFMVSGTSSAGCTGTAVNGVSVTVSPLPVILPAATKTIICAGDSLELTVAGALTYSWLPVSPSPVVKPSVSTTYTVSGTNANNCKGTSTLTVLVNSLPAIDIVSSDSSLCTGQAATLTASGALTYTWGAGSGPTFTIAPLVSTAYTVVGTGINGCTSSKIYDQPVVSCGQLSAISEARNVTCKGRNDGIVNIVLTTTYPSPKLTYRWLPQGVCPGNDCGILDSLQPGTYSVKVIVNYTVNNTPLSDSVFVSPVTILDENPGCDLVITNGITPNNDNINDTWQIGNIDLYPENHVMIFNRWGTEVYNVKGYNNREKAWPQSGKADDLSSTTYFYIIDPGNGDAVIRGWIELMGFK